MTKQDPVAARPPRLAERVEEAVGARIEGWSARFFRTRLQPVQLAKRLIRTMDAHRRIALERTFAPNSYLLTLSAADYASFEQYRRSLERDLAESVLSAARDRGYTLVAYPTVEIAQDPALRLGEVRVSSALLDATGAELADADLRIAASHTVVLDRDAVTVGALAPPGSLELSGGSQLTLGATPSTIGRDHRCAVVLDDPRVSRRHAEVRLRLGRYTLTDLNSTNGTRVNGAPVTEVALAEGDRIRIGPATLVFHAGAR